MSNWKDHEMFAETFSDSTNIPTTGKLAKLPVLLDLGGGHILQIEFHSVLVSWDKGSSPTKRPHRAPLLCACKLIACCGCSFRSSPIKNLKFQGSPDLIGSSKILIKKAKG